MKWRDGESAKNGESWLKINIFFTIFSSSHQLLVISKSSLNIYCFRKVDMCFNYICPYNML